MKIMKRIWCRIVGHRWTRPGAGFGYAEWWVCERCDGGRLLPWGVGPTR